MKAKDLIPILESNPELEIQIDNLPVGEVRCEENYVFLKPLDFRLCFDQEEITKAIIAAFELTSVYNVDWIFRNEGDFLQDLYKKVKPENLQKFNELWPRYVKSRNEYYLGGMRSNKLQEEGFELARELRKLIYV